MPSLWKLIATITSTHEDGTDPEKRALVDLRDNNAVGGQHGAGDGSCSALLGSAGEGRVGAAALSRASRASGQTLGACHPAQDAGCLPLSACCLKGPYIHLQQQVLICQ